MSRPSAIASLNWSWTPIISLRSFQSPPILERERVAALSMPFGVKLSIAPLAIRNGIRTIGVFKATS